ncbi:MAG: YiiX family permuted papain-like enzyme [Acidobacteria bacterium]|nr:YiiX family permuted papain-like enzyme [Acidobacteriota bacterium]
MEQGTNNFRVLKVVMIFLLIMTASCGRRAAFHNGDIIFQESLSSQSKALRLATGSPYTHVGILFNRKGKWVVYEAAQPVRMTALKKWQRHGKNGHYVVKRLKNPVSEAKMEKLRKAAKAWFGTPYDLKFQWSDRRMYCSEYVWKLYKRVLGIELAAPAKFKDFDFSKPAVRKKLKERFGTTFPADEPVIAPVQLFKSKLLKTVYIKGKL